MALGQKTRGSSLRIPFEQLHHALTQALLRLGFRPDRADLCARLFAETTRDGVYTHGLNRFPRFAAMVRNGTVDSSAEASLDSAMGALERWNGHSGPGNLNAWRCMERAVELAREHGVGAVALRGTNHWMRGGTYGWQAADSGAFGICFTNTLPNLPPWGAAESVVGNNPLVLAVPRPSGAHVVLDMAMSQYSYGTLAAYAKRGEPLPFPGGFDAEGLLTMDAAAIEASGRALPIGLWKGSGLAVVLDLLAAMLSGGKATHEIARDPLRETELSQVFLAVDAGRFEAAELTTIAEGTIASLHEATSLIEGRPVRYPGEETLRVRQENEHLGVPVEPAVWAELQALAAR